MQTVGVSGGRGLSEEGDLGVRLPRAAPPWGLCPACGAGSGAAQQGQPAARDGSGREVWAQGLLLWVHVSSEAAGHNSGGSISGPHAPKSRQRGPGSQARQRVSQGQPGQPLSPSLDAGSRIVHRGPSHGSPHQLGNGALPAT